MPYILTSIDDVCAITYEVVQGRFLGIAAPDDVGVPTFQCPRVQREQATAQLRLKGDIVCEDSAMQSQCMAVCAEKGFYINEDMYGEDDLPIAELGCFSSRSSEAGGCVCPGGNSTYDFTATNISGWFGPHRFSAQGNRAGGVVDLMWWEATGSACRASFSLFQGTFLGVSAGESFLTSQRAKEAALAANVLVGTGAGSAVVNSVLGAGTGGAAALSLIFQVQFLALAANLGGQRMVEVNETLERLPSLMPEGVRTFSERVAWVNFQGWGVFDFSPLCDTLASDAGDIFEVICNCLLSLAGCSLLRLLYRVAPKLTHKTREHAGELGDDQEHPDAAAFPSWELKLLEVEFQGICLATGAALGSRCSTYVNTGITMLLCLLLVIAGLVWKLDKHMRGSAFARKFVPDPAFAKYKRIAARKGERTGWMAFVKQKHHEFEALCSRGEWKLIEHAKHAHSASNRSLLRASSSGKPQGESVALQRVEDAQFQMGFRTLFETYMGDRWWYGIWLFAKHLIQGVILGTTAGAANWSVVLLLHITDLALMVFARPMIDAWDIFTEAHSMLSRLVLLIGAGSFLEGATDEATFGSLFLLSSVAGLVPTYTNTAVVEIPTLIYTIYAKLKGIKEDKDTPLPDDNEPRDASDVSERKGADQPPDDRSVQSPVYVTQSPNPMDSGVAPPIAHGDIDRQLDQLPRLDPDTLQEIDFSKEGKDKRPSPHGDSGETRRNGRDGGDDLRSSFNGKTHVFKSGRQLRNESATSRDEARSDLSDREGGEGRDRDRTRSDSRRSGRGESFQDKEVEERRRSNGHRDGGARRGDGDSMGGSENGRVVEDQTASDGRGAGWRDKVGKAPADFSFKLGRDTHWSRGPSDAASDPPPPPAGETGKRASRRQQRRPRRNGSSAEAFWDDVHDQLDDIVEGAPLEQDHDKRPTDRDADRQDRDADQQGGGEGRVSQRGSDRARGSERAGRSSHRRTRDRGQREGGEGNGRLSFQTARSRSERSEAPPTAEHASFAGAEDVTRGGDGVQGRDVGRHSERRGERRSSRRQRNGHGERGSEQHFDAREIMRDLESWSSRHKMVADDVE